MVIWIIGMSGTGKTTLATKVVYKIRGMNRKVVLLDGDLIRELFDNDVDHTIEGRLRNAKRLSVLSKFLADQNIHVVAAVLSIFPTWQKWNREIAGPFLMVVILTLPAQSLASQVIPVNHRWRLGLGVMLFSGLGWVAAA